MLRFAASTTREMYIGDLRIAIINYIMAKKLNEKLLIRIEDTDKEKNIEGKEKEILEMLSLFSIDSQNVVYQSENIKYHQKLAMQLMSQKKAFACFCSDEKLEELKQIAIKEKKTFVYDGFCETLSDQTILEVNAPFTVRIKKPQENIKFNDILKGDLEYSPLDVDSFIILKHDKSPTYNYACAVDDMLNDISMVIQDEENISNIAKQIHVRNSLGYDKEIKYVNLPKLSNDEKSAKWLIDEGFLPAAIANYLVLLGNKIPKEIFSLEEAIEWFEIENIETNVVKFDIEKLKVINIKHLKNLDELRLSKLLGFADVDLGKLAKLYLCEATTLKEIKSIFNAIFAPKINCEGFEKEFIKLKESLKKAPYFNDFNELKKYIADDTKLDEKIFLEPLRYILTGANSGPQLNDIYPLIKNYLGEIVK